MLWQRLRISAASSRFVLPVRRFAMNEANGITWRSTSGIIAKRISVTGFVLIAGAGSIPNTLLAIRAVDSYCLAS